MSLLNNILSNASPLFFGALLIYSSISLNDANNKLESDRNCTNDDSQIHTVRAFLIALVVLSSIMLLRSIEKATGVLFNVTGGTDLRLSELNEAAEVIQNVVHPDANIIFGMNTDEKMNTQVKLTVIATGMPTDEKSTLPSRDILDDPDMPPFMSRIKRFQKKESDANLKQETDVA